MHLFINGETEVSDPKHPSRRTFSRTPHRKWIRHATIGLNPGSPTWSKHSTTRTLHKSTHSKRLIRAENATYGNDGTIYRHWKTVDPECITRHLTFAVCMKSKRITTDWKSSKPSRVQKMATPTKSRTGDSSPCAEPSTRFTRAAWWTALRHRQWQRFSATHRKGSCPTMMLYTTLFSKHTSTTPDGMQRMSALATSFYMHFSMGHILSHTYFQIDPLLWRL